MRLMTQQIDDRLDVLEAEGTLPACVPMLEEEIEAMHQWYLELKGDGVKQAA